jgi:predicted ATPase/DNA-binding CsgD family transcriptional regulator
VGCCPRNLPADISSFVGRRQELSDGRVALTSTRLLTLTGVGGVGKTRLALRLAERVSAAFPDGVWLVDLAPLRDADLLVPTVASVFGLRDQAGRPPLARLLDYLADKRTLLVLDNCEHLIDSCAMLSSKLLGAAPSLRILATSRIALGTEGERLLSVPPLSVPDHPECVSVDRLIYFDAIRLFVDRATAALPDFTLTADTATAVTGICRRLDGIPLAIELAAAQVRALAVQGIFERLDRRFRLLTKGNLGRPQRHETLRAAIEWSYELCSPAEKILWARMSVFSGACDLEAIQAVCSGNGIETEDMVELVAGLVNQSILLRENHGPRARYRLLETLREFGHDALTSAGELAAVLARHFDYYYRRLTEYSPQWFGPRQTEWIGRMRMELPNLRAALEYGLTEPGKAQDGLKFAAILHILWLWSITVSLREGTRWLRRALALNPEPTAARAEALHGCAFLLITLGDIDSALPMLQECRTLAEELGDDSAFAYATLRAGSAKIYQNDISGGFALLEQALERLRSLDDPFGAYYALRYLSMAAAATGDPRCEVYAQECLTQCETYGSIPGRSWALWVLGLANWRQGDPKTAAARIRESLKIKQSLKVEMGVRDFTGEANCIEVLAWTAAGLGDMRRAARLLGASRALWEKFGSSLVAFSYFQRFREPIEQQVREVLSAHSYEELFREGANMDIDKAIDYALERKTAEQSGGRASVLTHREQQIAELICEGLSNRDLADRLVISQRTVESHIEHIMSKLDFNSRAQIATWVVETKPPPDPVARQPARQ